MDLRNNEITVGELLKNDAARGILQRRFPQLNNPMMLMLAKNMRLSEVLRLADGRVEPEEVQAALGELRAI